MKRGAATAAAIQRILVAVDGSEHSLAALDMAAALAAQSHAELEALFVEDEELLRLADLPCARVVSLALLRAERVDRERMERRLRLQAERVRASLEKRAAALGLRATFRTVRGAVTAEILAAAAEADLLSLGRAGHGSKSWPRCGSTLRAAIASGRPVLVAQQRAPGKGLLVAYDGSPAAVRALDLAGRLAAGAGQGLQLVALAGSPAKAERLATQARQRLARQGVQVEAVYMAAEPRVVVPAMARQLRVTLLALGLSEAGESGREQAEHLLGAVDCMLLLVP